MRVQYLDNKAAGAVAPNGHARVFTDRGQDNFRPAEENDWSRYNARKG